MKYTVQRQFSLRKRKCELKRPRLSTTSHILRVSKKVPSNELSRTEGRQEVILIFDYI